MGVVPGDGAMTVTDATEDELLALLPDDGKISIAAVNGPRSVVFSGDRGAVGALAARLAARGHRTTALRVSHAFHSPRMDGVLDEFRAIAAGLDYREPRLPIVSALTGKPVTGTELGGADYWVRQLREKVDFQRAMRWLDEQKVQTFCEIGPDATLTPSAQACLSGNQTTVVPAQLKGRPEALRLTMGVARLWCAGAELDWTAFLPRGRKVPLPTYASIRANSENPRNGNLGCRPILTR
jgi:acyl transferase domain-containing protein